MEFNSEMEILQELMVANHFRPKKDIVIAKEIKMQTEIWEKKQGTRTDLQGISQEERLSTRKKLSIRFKMSEATISKYQKILECMPSLFERIDAGKMSIDGAYNLIRVIEKYGLGGLEEKEQKLRVIETCAPDIFSRIDQGEIGLEEGHRDCVRQLYKTNRPQPKSETEASSKMLAGVPAQGSVESDEDTSDDTSDDENVNENGDDSYKSEEDESSEQEVASKESVESEPVTIPETSSDKSDEESEVVPSTMNEFPSNECPNLECPYYAKIVEQQK